MRIDEVETDSVLRVERDVFQEIYDELVLLKKKFSIKGFAFEILPRNDSMVYCITLLKSIQMKEPRDKLFDAIKDIAVRHRLKFMPRNLLNSSFNTKPILL